MPEQEPQTECSYSSFHIPSDEDLASANEHLRSISPEMAAIMDRAEQRRAERYTPPEPTRKQIAGEFIKVIVLRALLAAGCLYGGAWLLWGDRTGQPPAPAPNHAQPYEHHYANPRIVPSHLQTR